MSSLKLLTSKQVLLIVGVNALISAVISVAVGLLLIRPARLGSVVVPTATGRPTSAVTVAAATATALVHVVQPGDTISGLALKYDVPAEDIIAANHIQDPNVLQVGTELIIPIGGLPQITPTWTPMPTPTDTSIPFQPPSADLTATALALLGPTATSTPTAGSPTSEASEASATSPAPVTTSTVTVTQVQITQVIAPGNADREAAVIVNKGKQVVDLQGWTLSDANGNVYTFSDLRLWPEGSATVNTRIGQNNNPPFNFFWGKLQAIWSAGETATLKDAEGKVISTYTVGQ